ncbi:DUF4397 domain-containing protein [Sandaracinus amylolyticus]|uniref:DUF4397 domain-containing protein n=1 Tax=Sandaracinus amylolyticus TaxID=927083 RepID=UPI001F47620B|nr:DUF4397 domain-containing protein [Sandaracinus amylolyticus]UJR79448.1 Hypothetical protein I5071_14840 [Sandaracinus amylolyticus]
MIGTTKRVAICAALLALGGMTAACGDDDDGGGTDAGRADAGRDSGTTGDMDSGTDGGGDTVDSGSDAGLPAASIRLAHLISDAVTAENPNGFVHVCLEAPTGGAQSLLTQRVVSGTPTPFPIPYRGVSDYISTAPLNLLPLEYTVHVYPVFAGSTCPATDTALFSIGVDTTDLMPGNYYTIAATGLLAGSGAQAPQFVIIEDDRTEPADGQTRVRLVHAIPNIPVPVDVCYDPDYTFPGGVPTPGPMEAVSLFANQSYIGAALSDPPVAMVRTIDYVSRTPITGGLIAVFPRAAGATDCATANPLSPGVIRIPVPLPVPPAGTPNIPGNISAGATFDDGEIVSIFAVGDVTFTPAATTTCATDADCTAALPAGQGCNPVAHVCQHPRGPTVVPWVDNYTP